MARLTAAIIGVGEVARAHLAAFDDPRVLRRVDLVGAADVDPLARSAAEQLAPGIDVFPTAEALLEDLRPDVVTICTWPDSHADLVELACEHGAVAVLCEKPMALDLVDARRMVDAAERCSVRLFVGHQRRFVPRYREAKALIDADRVGPPRAIHAFARGDLLTDGTHALDLARFLVGDPPCLWVQGALDIQRPLPMPDDDLRYGYQRWNIDHTRYGHRVETGCLAVAGMSDGSRIHLEIGSLGDSAYQRLVVEGESGLLFVGGEEDDIGLDLVSADERLTVRAREHDRVDPFADAMLTLLDAAEQERPHPLDAANALHTHEILMAIYHSGRTSTRLTLPYDGPAGHPLALVDRWP